MFLLSTEIYIITLFFTIILSVFVLSNNRNNPVNIYFSLLGFSIGLWILNNVFIDLLYDQKYSLPIARIAIIWVALLPIFFNQFVRHLYFPDDKRYEKMNRFFLYISYAITLIIILFNQTSLNIKTIGFESWGVSYQPGVLYILLFFYMLIVFGFSFINLFKLSLEPKNQKRYQVKYILLGACITVVLSIFTNIIFPFIGFSFASIFGPITILIFLIFIAYSITKHKLFNIRVIAIEIVTFAIWITLLIRIFLAETQQDLFVGLGLLVVTMIFGILLIRSTINEILQLEHIDKLTEELQKSYATINKLSDALDVRIAVQTEEKTTVDKV